MVSIYVRRQSRSVAATGSRHTRDAADVIKMCVLFFDFSLFNRAMRDVMAVEFKQERKLNKRRSAAICSPATVTLLRS